ncbi:unnamed protein product [Moneuplotes crassus]|uniref:Uncharacterized protein n=1 Tax=Euplotes crassus TaxID=5936 RepID=A0AAD1U560_EUPCR|nr:unnamed protein product [Moneuplotes crassus]
MTDRNGYKSLNSDLSPLQPRRMQMKCFVSQNVSTSDSPVTKCSRGATLVIKPIKFSPKKELKLNSTQLSLTMEGREKKFRGIRRALNNGTRQKLIKLSNIIQN